MLCGKIFAESNYLHKEYDYPTEEGSLIIEKDKLIFLQKSESGKLYTDISAGFDYFISDENKYIILNYTNEEFDFLTLVKATDSKQYKSWGMPYCINISRNYKTYAQLRPFCLKRAETYISEKDKDGKDINFLPDPLFNINSNPWAVKENSNKKIIHLRIENTTNPTIKYKDIEELIIINGFVNPKKRYLYGQNSRAKRIRISYDDVSFETTLQDTGNYQSVSLPKTIKNKNGTMISLEILDSYKGSKYSDIVISGVLYIDVVEKY